MNTANPITDHDHDWAQHALPWEVNGTLADADAERLHRHLRHCAACRSDLETERRIAHHIAQEIVVPHRADLGLAELMRNIDAEVAASQQTEPASLDRPRKASSRVAARPWYAVAAVTQAAAILFLSLAVLSLALKPGREAEYRTLSDTPLATRGVHLQVVFSDTLSRTDIDRLLGQVSGHILVGPTPAGVVLVALPPDTKPDQIDLAAARLLQEPGVRFVAVQPYPTTP
jgi:hypothetical protein